MPFIGPSTLPIATPSTILFEKLTTHLLLPHGLDVKKVGVTGEGKMQGFEALDYDDVGGEVGRQLKVWPKVNLIFCNGPCIHLPISGVQLENG